MDFPASAATLWQPDPRELPLTFRAEIAPDIFRALLGGWSVALVGLRGCGKSNLLRFVCEARVVKQYAGDVAHGYLFVYVDGNLLRDVGEANLCHAVLDALAQAARASKWPEPEIGPVLDAVRHYQAYERQMLGLGVLARVLDILCREKRKRVVLVFDEFDAAFAQLDRAVLRGLRAVRDDHKGELLFLAGTRVELSRLAARRKAQDWESGARQFATLFEHRRFHVGPYRHADAVDLIARKTTDLAQPLSGEQVEILIRLTGGYASLLLAGIDYVRARPELPPADLARGLSRVREVEQCCQDIWDDLDPSERGALIELAASRRSQVAPDDVENLRWRSLVVGYPPSLFCDVWEAFVVRQTSERL
ncbi:MAG TPA: hypothetical protein VJG32_19780 [Anaerolineae bacterium]|nr:hypothetical protein [Anaerolineae bacterium]